MGAAQYLHEAQGPIITNQNNFFSILLTQSLGGQYDFL
jgi:hypothetical protein